MTLQTISILKSKLKSCEDSLKRITHSAPKRRSVRRRSTRRSAPKRRSVRRRSSRRALTPVEKFLDITELDVDVKKKSKKKSKKNRKKSKKIKKNKKNSKKKSKKGKKKN